VEFSEWDMKCPLMFTQVTHRALVQPKAFANPDAGGPHQEKGVCEKIIGLSQFGGQELIDLGRKGFWKI
jgi:hypothetical protein